jgi:hypothetical protein
VCNSSPEECMVRVRNSAAAIFLTFICMIATSSAFGAATNVYITQTGGPSGNCTSNVQTPAFFNNASNWGSGASQIGPGTTVLLCGTFTFATNASGLIVQGSGTSTSAVTIQFDSGAVLQSNAFGGFASPYGAGIVINGFNYITVDGQNTGTIKNLLNGTSGQTCLGGTCSVQQSSLGLYIHNTTGVEVKNLTVSNIYMDKNAEQNGGGGGAAWESADVYTDGPNTSLIIDGNTLKDAHVGAWVSFDHGSTTANIFNNTIAHHAWQISAANGTSCSASASINIYDNDLSNWNDWNAGGSASYHTDGIIEYTKSTGCSAPTFNPQIYNNFFHGDLDGGTGSGTAHIYCSNDTGGSTSFANSTCTAFNNIIDESTQGNTNCAAAVWVAGQGAQFYNNTLIAPSTCSKGSSYGFVFGASTEAVLKNNILNNFKNNYGDPGPYGNVATEVASSDHNVFYNCTGGSNCFSFGQGNWSTLAAWSAARHVDTNSSAANPLLTGNYTLGTGSPAIGLGDDMDAVLGLNPCCQNITPPQANIGLNALAYDKTLAARTVSGSWNSGAYEGANVGLAPPTGLIATVH